MNEKKNTKFIIAASVFIVLLVICLVLVKSFPPSDIYEKITSGKINSPDRLNSRVVKSLINIIILGIAVLAYLIAAKLSWIEPVKKIISNVFTRIANIFTIKLLLVSIILYLAVLFFLAVSRFDLGIDEAGYLIYAKSFAHNGFAYCVLNGRFLMMDNYAMLPMYLFSVINFHLGFAEIWQLKLLASLLSLCSVFVVFRIAQKLYNEKIAVLFLFFLVIQPGFGFVASSFFGEIVQAAFFFSGVYFWLKDSSPMNTKKVFIISLLFALSIQTKFQVSQSVFLSLIIFHFVDKKKKALPVLFTSIALVILIALIRVAPALIFNKSYLMPYLKFWFAEFFENANRTVLILLDRAQFFNKFLSFIFITLLLGGIFLWAKKPHEKFIALFTMFYLLWWIVYFWLSNYRVLFIGIIPFFFLLAAFVYDFYERYRVSKEKSQNTLAWISAACLVLLMIYGCSINIIYASIGNNDAVQFDLDGAKSRLSQPVVYDNSQKEFYREAKNVLEGVDSVYIASGGQACFLPQFYLGEYRIFDKDFLKKSAENSPGKKYVIIDRTAFPLGLEEGYKVLDAMNLRRNLVLKKGEYELYEVAK